MSNEYAERTTQKSEKNGKKKKIINYLLYKSENNYYLYLNIDLIEFWRSKWA